VLHKAPDNHEDVHCHHDHFKVKAADEIKFANGLINRTFGIRVENFDIFFENESSI